jgi:enhancing lycopene biosynthesis protein 2
MTLGKKGSNFPYSGTIDLAASFGNNMEEQDVQGLTVDWKNNIVTTPCYMQADASPIEVHRGIDYFIRKVTSLVKQNTTQKE